MALVQSVLYWGFVGVTSILLFPLAALVRGLTQFFDPRLVVLHRFTSIWASLYTWLSPAWHVSVEGREHIDPKEAYVMTANHQSAVDIFVMFRLLVHYKWVSKTENFKIPFIGWNMRMNRYIEIRRGGVKAGQRMMRDCEKALAQGSSVMIFPEGTRSETGRLRPFKRGAFELAKSAGRSILPIVIQGSSDALPKRGVKIRGSHRIRIRVLPPLSPESFANLSAEDLTAKVHALLAAELARMQAEVGIVPGEVTA